MSFRPFRILFLLCCALLAFPASGQKSPTLFRLLPPAQTGVTFKNTIRENDQLNILNEAYIYNGGGVGIGDFNKDGLQDIYFSANATSNKLYLNKGGLKFQDITTAAGVGGDNKWCTGVSVVDINTDGWPDLYVSATFLKDPKKRTNLLYINQGTNAQGVPTFKEAAKSYGIADEGYSTQGTFFDYDKDGDLDLFLVTNTLDDPKTPIQFRPKVTDGSALNTDRLYRNNGNGTFTNVSAEAGITIEGWGHAASISDINGDGWPDIYVSNDFIANDICYINNGNGTFTDRITEFFRHTSWYTMGTDITDINNDGYVDLVALDMLPEKNLRKKGMMMGNEYYNYFNNRKFGYQHQYVRNVLQLNSGRTPAGGPVFSDVGFLAGIYETDWSWTPLVADFDNDGFRDLVITNGLPRDVTDGDYIAYDNGQGGGAANTSLKMVDALPVVKIPNYAFRNNGGFTFSNTSKSWGLDQPSFSNGAAYADLDNDGDLDIVINNINETAFVYENTLNTKGGNGGGHHLSLSFTGNRENPLGIGATVSIHYGGGKLQYYEHQPCRGYLSTVDNRAHFGLGPVALIDSLRVTWPDGRSQLLTGIKGGGPLELAYRNAAEGSKRGPTENPLFEQAAARYGLTFRHTEKDAVDYNIQVTLPHKLSQFGPGIAVGDVDGNGHEDVYLGGSAGNPGTFFLQDATGRFTGDAGRIVQEENARTEEMGVLLFDADGDKDLDLYVVSGSYEFSPKNGGNQDRLYINDGKGGFTWNRQALPAETANGSCVRAADFDRDGDLDLFVGGRSVSGGYPAAPKSFLLKNDGGTFTDVTAQYCPQLQQLGMITDALWSDYDNDGKIDLVLTGEWMPVTFLKNTGTAFTPHTASGVSGHKGWWNSLASGDFDSDGDIDYAAGNLGLNSPFRGTAAEPMTLLVKDLDNNGKPDPMIFCYMRAEDGTRKPFPMHTKDDLASQLVSIRKTYPTYKSFGRATMDELWPKGEREGALVLQANYMASAYLENKGNGQFSLRPLPVEAQVAPLYGMMGEDADGDGHLDLLLAGNDYGMEPGSGRHDAFNGLFLKGDGKGGFSSTPVAQSGFFIPGDAKGLARVQGAGNEPLILATQNSDSLLVFRKKNGATGNAPDWIQLNEHDFSAEVTYADNRKRKLEFYYGATFLPQSSRRIALDWNVSKVVITDFKGNKREVKGTGR